MEIRLYLTHGITILRITILRVELLILKHPILVTSVLQVLGLLLVLHRVLVDVKPDTNWSVLLVPNALLVSSSRMVVWEAVPVVLMVLTL
jgi:hypothetical protein